MQYGTFNSPEHFSDALHRASMNADKIREWGRQTMLRNHFLGNGGEPVTPEQRAFVDQCCADLAQIAPVEFTLAVLHNQTTDLLPKA